MTDKRLYKTRIFKSLRSRYQEQITKWEKEYDTHQGWQTFYRKMGKTFEQGKRDYVLLRLNQFLDNRRLAQKFARISSSNRYKISQKRKYRQMEKRDHNENLNIVNNILDTLQQLVDKYTKELTEQAIKNGKNVNYSRTRHSIQYNVNKRIIAETDLNPENILGKNPEELIRFLLPKYDKQVTSINHDRWLFDIPDEKLTPILIMAKHDPEKYVGALRALDIVRELQKGYASMSDKGFTTK